MPVTRQSKWLWCVDACHITAIFDELGCGTRRPSDTATGISAVLFLCHSRSCCDMSRGMHHITASFDERDSKQCSTRSHVAVPRINFFFARVNMSISFKFVILDLKSCFYFHLEQIQGPVAFVQFVEQRLKVGWTVPFMVKFCLLSALKIMWILFWSNTTLISGESVTKLLLYLLYVLRCKTRVSFSYNYCN